MLFGVSEEKIKKWANKGKVNKVIKATENSKEEIRNAAILALGELHQDEAFNKLVLFLRDPSAEVRGLACEALGKQGKPLAVEHLRYVASNDEDKNVQEKAIEALKLLDVEEEEEQ